MPSNHASYRTDIIDEPFETPEGVRYAQTVGITFLNNLNNIIVVRKYGYADKAAIYEKIRNGEEVNLDHTFTDNFSLREYRKRYKLSPDTSIELNNFSAREAFFEGDHQVSFSHAKFTGKHVSFANTAFGHCDISFRHADFGNVDADFSEVNFGSGNADFSDVRFGEGKITFENARFRDGDVSFVNTHFGDGNVNFRNVNFGRGKIDFHFAKFGKGDISFEKSLIGDGKVDFRKVEFGSGKVDFRRVEFGNGEVSFEGAEFKSGKINFRSATFGSGDVSFELVNFGKDEVIFDRVDFGSGNISFHGARGNTISLKGCFFNSYLDLRVADCNTIDLSDAIVRDIIDFVPLDEPVKIREVSFNGIHNLGRIFIDWERNNVASLILSQRTTTTREKADQFRILKEDFSSTGLYNDEDRAYVQLKRMELKALREDMLAANRMNALWIYPATWFQRVVFDYMGVYATNPIRVLMSMLATYTLFSIIYLVLPFISPSSVIASSIGDPEHLSTVSKAFYHSAVTFLTIGYGDFFPMHHARWISALEGFMGLFLMAYFTVAFVRKILR